MKQSWIIFLLLMLFAMGIISSAATGAQPMVQTADANHAYGVDEITGLLDTGIQTVNNPAIGFITSMIGIAKVVGGLIGGAIYPSPVMFEGSFKIMLYLWWAIIVSFVVIFLIVLRGVHSS